MKELEIIFYFICLIIISLLFWYNWIYKQSVIKETKKIGISLPRQVIFALALNISFPLACGVIIAGLIINHILKEGF